MKSRWGSSLLVTLLIMTAGAAYAADEPPLLLKCFKADAEIQSVLLSPRYVLSEREAQATRYWIVQFENIVSNAAKEGLEKAGCKVFDYIPENAYLVRTEKIRQNSLSAFPGVLRALPLQPYCKLDPKLVTMKAKEYYVHLIVWCFPDEPDKLMRMLFAQYGVRVEQTSNVEGQRYAVEAPAAAMDEFLPKLCRMESLRWVERKPVIKAMNDHTIGIMQSGISGGGATPMFSHGLHGEGQIIGYSDTGLDYDSCYFWDATQGIPDETLNPSQRKILAYHSWTTPNDYDAAVPAHGTHVCGILAGDNFATPPSVHDTGDGMAPAAKVVVQDVCIEDAFVGVPDDLHLLFQQAYDDGVRLHSNSWGDPYETAYISLCRDTDDFMWTHRDFLVFYANGNEGPFMGTVTMPANTKNCLSIGSTDAWTFAEDLSDFSSHGPSEDGRLKPEVTICGGSEENPIWSALGDNDVNTFNCDLFAAEGTSMATPAACGGAALIRQYFTTGFYPGGVATPANDITPSNSLMRAMVINSGVNMTGFFTGDDGYFDPSMPIPTMGQGWGRITLANVLPFTGSTRRLLIKDQTIGLNTLESDVIHVRVANGALPFKVTLAWVDYPSNLDAEKNLVNDLDLVVERVTPHIQYLGSVFSNGQSVTGGQPDRLNNEENFLLLNPSAGDYTITVHGYNVPMGPQPYGLVITGALNFSNGTVELDRRQYGCHDSMKLTVRDDDLTGAGLVSVNVHSTSNPGGFTDHLSETPAGSGYFVGLVQTVSSSPGPNQLLVQDADQIGITYIDASDGSGGTNISKTASAVADCTPPIISEVYAVEITDNSATIIWRTNENSTSKVLVGTSTPPTQLLNTDALAVLHATQLTGLTQETVYYFQVESTDACLNTAMANNGGLYYTFKTFRLVVAYQANMDTNPGWTISGGQWAWGQPTGQGGELDPPDGIGSPDPTAGYTGTNIMGYNLHGNYACYLPAYRVTTPMVDLTAGYRTRLEYKRWLGVEAYIPIFEYGDNAKIQMTIDNGVSWSDIWWNDQYDYDDGAWVDHIIDLNPLADHQPHVGFRWVMGPTDDLYVLCGWNIDDVRVTYLAPGNQPNLWYTSITYIDDGGNHDGLPNAGESITMQVAFKNFGVSATNVRASLVSRSAFANVTGTTPLNLGNIPAGGTATTPSPYFHFDISPDMPEGHVVQLYINYQSNEGSGSMDIEISPLPHLVPALTGIGLILLLCLVSVLLLKKAA